MKTHIQLFAIALQAALFIPMTTHAQSTLSAALDKPGVKISPVMHGVFFEDINYGADGGLYAELVPNRSFENRDNLFAWETVARGAKGEVRIETAGPLNAKNTRFARLDIKAAGMGFGVANSGFDGIPVRKGRNYRLSVYARATGAATLAVTIEDAGGRTLGETRVVGLGKEWRKFEALIACKADADKAKLVVLAKGGGTVDLDMVSLFPEDTWNKRKNGLRADLVKMLADMKPGFMRFPGGCIVEGKDLANAYRWKDTIGDVAERPQNWNRWQDAVAIKAPQYYQTYGLGFFEYFQLCEDIGAAPVPILNCGMSCQYQDKQLVPLAELDPFVQDALDLIEFANGPATSTWGAKRAAMGHPAPFQLKLLGVGNEQWDEQYFERYNVFYKAIKAKYPGIKLITTSGPGVDDKWWNLAWGKFRSGTPADIVDEHYYRPPQWFLDQAGRYDGYDRKGPKVFAGEFAAHEPNRASTLRCALVEAAFMTGLLRNGDVVEMASYAPLFAREGFTQWTPDMIWVNATQVFGTPTYYTQAMFSRNRPDRVMPVEIKQADDKTRDLYAVAGVDEKAGEAVLFIVNVSGRAVDASLQLGGVKIPAQDARATVLTSGSQDDVNSFATPRKVAPREERVRISSAELKRTFPASSFTVLRITLQK